jgi:hypothetical protein
VSNLADVVARKRQALEAEMRSGERIRRPMPQRRTVAEQLETVEREISRIEAMPEHLRGRNGFRFWLAERERLLHT